MRVTRVAALALLALSLVLALGVAAASATVNPAAGVAHFSGNGPTLLSPLRFTRPVVVRWTEADRAFILVGVQAPRTFGRLPRLVDSNSRSGARHLPKGIYRLRVETSGSWTITVG